MLKYFAQILCYFLFINKYYGQLVAHAGPSTTICINTSVLLGDSPSATGGTPPYTYDWQPSTFFGSNTISNPIASGMKTDTWFILTVRDQNNAIATSAVLIRVDQIHTFSAGVDTGYCLGQQAGIRIGSQNNINASITHTFTWYPSVGLDSSGYKNPIATPSVTSVYQLIVRDGICPDNLSYVTVTTFTPPVADAGRDTTINEGDRIKLDGVGDIHFSWEPDYNIMYSNTLKPDVWPIVTKTYTLATEDVHKCYDYDTVRVTVIQGDKLFFYKAFTPNGDGSNDFFYIGNAEKYPDNNLKIYNRYGVIIYSATNYTNNWDGEILGDKVPTGTYFYIFDDGKGKKYKGSFTILR